MGRLVPTFGYQMSGVGHERQHFLRPSRDSMSTPTKTVAVVDDDRSMLVGVERLLNAHGYAT